jgi:hypothetical protein
MDTGLNLFRKKAKITEWETKIPFKMGSSIFNLQQIYTNEFDICKDNILLFCFLHRNIATNKFLFKCKLVESSHCNFGNKYENRKYILDPLTNTNLLKWIVEMVC